MRLFINIGLESNEKADSLVFPKGIPAKYATDLFVSGRAPARIVRSEVRQSNTEETLVLVVETPLPSALIGWLKDAAGNLEQDAIAVFRPDVSEGLVVHQSNPKTRWGDFDPALFLMPTNA